MSREPLFGARQKLPTALPAREADHRERATAVVRSTYVREAQEVERLGSFIVCRLRLGGEAPEEQQPRLVVGQLQVESREPPPQISVEPFRVPLVLETRHKWSRALARWCAGVPWPSPPFPASCPCRQHHHSVSNAPSSNRTGPFRSSGFPTVFTAWRAEAMHDRAVELVEPRLLEEGGRECPKALATSFVLPPQEVHELGVDVRVHLLEMPVGVPDAEVLTPAPKNRVQRPNFLLETVEVILRDRIADLVSDAAHRFRRRPAIAEASFRVAAHRHEPKVHPEKVESIGGVDSTRLLRAQGQTQAPDDVLQPAKPRLRVSSAENHQVVTVANQFRSAHPRLPFDVESMQICVRDQWRNHTALWRTRDHRPHGSVFQDARLQPSTNKAQYPRVTDTPSNRGDQALMGQRVKARFQISVGDVTRASRYIRLNLADGFAS